MEADGFIPYTLKVWVWVARLHTLPGLYLSFWPVASIWNLVPGAYDCIRLMTLQGFLRLIYLHV